ncbi:MAG: hypothetical protein ABIO19_16735 [Burkholderiaceae bacterium]
MLFQIRLEKRLPAYPSDAAGSAPASITAPLIRALEQNVLLSHLCSLGLPFDKLSGRLSATAVLAPPRIAECKT